MLLSDDKSILQEVVTLWENEYEIEIKFQEGKIKQKMKGEEKFSKVGFLGEIIKFYRY